MAGEDIIRSIVSDPFAEGRCPELDDIFAHFDFDNEEFVDRLTRAGSTWEGLLDYFLSAAGTDARRIANVFYFFSPQAYVYFTPAYLGFVHHREGDEVGEGFFTLMEPRAYCDVSGWAEWACETWSLFSDRQLRVLGVVACMYYARPSLVESSYADRVRFWASVAVEGINHAYQPDG